jgi:CRISPR/Cas system-associated exonuclease Cas4 (RecB family)
MKKSFSNLAKMITEATRQKPIEEEFLYMLEESIVRHDLSERRKPSQTFKPSSLGGCLRSVYYEVTGADLDPDTTTTASSVGIRESGTDRHIRIQTAIARMKSMGYPYEYMDVEEYLKKHPQKGTRVVEKNGMETKVYNEILNLSFMCDGILLRNGVYYVLEIKTETSNKAYNRIDPEPKHKIQATCYSIAFSIPRVIYIYENRDVCTKKSFLYVVSEEDKFEKVIAPIEEVNNHIEMRTLPPKTTNKKECRYCNYQEKCRRDEITESYYVNKS